MSTQLVAKRVVELLLRQQRAAVLPGYGSWARTCHVGVAGRTGVGKAGGWGRNWSQSANMREAGGGLSQVDFNKEIERINGMFSEARLQLTEAMDSVGSVYFQSDLDDAKELVEDTMSAWRLLLSRAPSEAARTATQRSMGLKMSQLTAELESIIDQLRNDD